MNAPAAQAPPILHLSSVVGSPLRDSAGERLGKVEDVIVRRAWIVGIFADEAEGSTRWSELEPLLVQADVSVAAAPEFRALEEQEFLSLLADVGFENPTIEPTRIYDLADARGLIEGTGIDPALAELSTDASDSRSSS